LEHTLNHLNISTAKHGWIWENVGLVLDNGIGFGQALKCRWRWAIYIMPAKVIKAQFLCIGWSGGFSAWEKKHGWFWKL